MGEEVKYTKKNSVPVSKKEVLYMKPEKFVAKATAYIRALGSVIPPVLGDGRDEPE